MVVAMVVGAGVVVGFGGRSKRSPKIWMTPLVTGISDVESSTPLTAPEAKLRVLPSFVPAR